MKQFTMSKKGIGTINFIVDDNGNRMIVRDGETYNIPTGEEFVAKYNAYISKGWAVKPAKEEKKVAAPTKPVKNDKPATPRFKWNKAGKRTWAIQASIYKRYFQETCEELKALKGREYHDRLDGMVKAEMKVFEAKMADVVNANI